MSQRNYLAYNRGGGQQHWMEHGAGGDVNAPNAPAASAPAYVGGQGKRVLDALGEFARVAGPMIGKEHARVETARVSDAVSAARREFEVWKNQYNQKNQGRLALNAQADYMQAWQEISRKYQDQWQGPENEIFGDALREKLAEEGLLNAARSGGAWEFHQRERWLDSQLAAQTDEFIRYAGNNPHDLPGIAQKWGDVKFAYENRPGINHNAELAKIRERGIEAVITRHMANGNLDDADRLLEWVRNSGANMRGHISAQFESGSSNATIGYDSNGGTSYGKYQLSSRQGSLKGWVDHIAKRDETGRAIAAEIAPLLAQANTGSRKGALPEKWKELAAQYGEYFESTQREYLMASHYEPALKSIKSQALREMILDDDSLQEMLYSTAVQHGPAGAASVLNAAWREGMSRDALIDAVYDERGTRFGKSSQEVRESVRKRFGEERELIRNGVQASGGGILSPQKIEYFQRQIEQARREAQSGDKFEFAQQHASVLEAAKSGIFVDTGKTEQDYIATFGDVHGKSLWQEYQDAKQEAEDVVALRGMTPEQQTKWLAESNPRGDVADASGQINSDYHNKVKQHERRVKLVDNMQKALMADPALYTFQCSQGAANAWQSFIGKRQNAEHLSEASLGEYMKAMAGAQEALGIPEEMRNYFPADFKKDMIARIMASGDPQGAMAALAGSAKSNFEPLRRELARAMSQEENLRCFVVAPEGNALLSRLDKEKKKEIVEAYNLKGERMSSLNLMLEDGLRDAIQSYPGINNSVVASGIMANAKDIAIALIANGMQDAEAAQKACELSFNHRYNFIRPIGAKPLRIPKQFDPQIMEIGINAIRKKIDMDNIDFATIPGTDEKLSKAAYRDALVNGATFAIAPDETGVEMMLAGQTVYGKDKKPRVWTWKQVEDVGLLEKGDRVLQEQAAMMGVQ